MKDKIQALDFALTGKAPAPTADYLAIESLSDVLDIPGGIVYLSDGGYSRIVLRWDTEPPTVYLALGALPAVKERWPLAQKERDEVVKCLRDWVEEFIP